MGRGCRGCMGQVRPTYIKRIAIELVENHGDRFTDDFDHNKFQVDELTDVKSISMRNRITGYVTATLASSIQTTARWAASIY